MQSLLSSAVSIMRTHTHMLKTTAMLSKHDSTAKDDKHRPFPMPCFKNRSIPDWETGIEVVNIYWLSSWSGKM